jgi:hypothetical protein
MVSNGAERVLQAIPQQRSQMKPASALTPDERDTCSTLPRRSSQEVFELKRELQSAIALKTYRKTHQTFAKYCKEVHGISACLGYKYGNGRIETRDNLSLSTRWRIWERDDFRCHYCGKRKFLTVDHKIAVANGGTDDDDNLLTACNTCNRQKGTETYDSFASPVLRGLAIFKRIIGEN